MRLLDAHSYSELKLDPLLVMVAFLPSQNLFIHRMSYRSKEFFIWASMYKLTAMLIDSFSIGIWDMFSSIIFMLALLLVLGMLRAPLFAQSDRKEYRLYEKIFDCSILNFYYYHSSK